MGLFDFLRKGKEEQAKPQQPTRPQQPSQQKPGMVDLNAKPNTTQDRPAAAPQQTGTISPVFYEIKKGDTLSAIAKQQLGDAGKWRTIYEANKDVIKNPDLIYPGQKIKIPK